MIDWKTNRVDQTLALLEKNGYEVKDEYKNDDIKTHIVKVLNKYKKEGVKPNWVEMSTIYSNIGGCDHHDLVRVDQIMTRMQNEVESMYQWGSLVMNFKMKKL